MRLTVWKINEGPTDGEFKAGDIFGVHDNTYVPGSSMTKWLCVEVEEYGGSRDELMASDYAVGATPDENVVLNVRKYYLDFSKLNTGEQDKWLNPATLSPVIIGRFTLDDIKRR